MVQRLGAGHWDPDHSTWKLAKIPQKDRALHCYVIGASGSGKTKFLEFLIQQDIQKGNGFAVIDPHSDLVEDIKGFFACYAHYYGEKVFDRVVVVDPTDPEYTACFNPLERLPGVSVAEQAQELISAFRKIWADSWGSRMEDLLRCSLIALGEAGLTLVELPRFLTSQSFRRRVLQQVSHPVVGDYFQRFDTLTERARITWIEPVTNKINALLADERVGQLFASPKSTFQLRELMDSGKVLLVKLDKGRLRDSADLLGSLILAKIKMAAFSRSDVPPRMRRPFHLYIDEFQNFATDSFGVVLSEARKYGLSLVMAHQTLAQVPSELRNLVLGNTAVQVYFRVGHQDAQVLANEAFVFSTHDVKSASMRGVQYRSAGEQRQLLAQDIQDLPPRVCYVKHKIEGGLVALRTVDIEAPWETLGVDERQYEQHLASLPLGRKYVIERKIVDHGIAERTKSGAALASTPVRDDSSGADVKPPDRTTTTPVARNEVTTGQELAAERSRNLPVESISHERVTQAPVYKELTTYLEHIAEHPFLPALQRDESLNLSRYKGSTIRRQLVDAGYVELHKVGTGTRSGQIVLQEITGAGYELLASMKIRVHRPRSRGGFLHKYYCYKLKEFAEVTWEGCIAQIEDGSLGKYADVTVRMPSGSGEESPSVIAFEVFMTGEAKEIRGIAKGVEVFDRVIVCAENRPSLESLKRKSVEALGSEILEKVSFHLVSQYLTIWTPEEVEVETSKLSKKPLTAPATKASILNREDPPIREQIILKSPAKSETEAEPTATTSGKRRGRPPKTPLMEQVEQAYIHLHDLDWLQECDIARLPEVQEKVQPNRIMPEAQALRSLLIAAASQVIEDMNLVPGKEGVAAFLKGYLVGRSVAEIAQELGVSREWCSRNYRREALRLAGMHLVRSISVES